MTNFFFRARQVACTALLPAVLLLLAAPLVRAQAPGWGGAAVGSLSQPNGSSTTQGVAADGSGNLFVTGTFRGSVAFGSTLLTSAGGQDVFVAKYVPATGTWAWAASGGGTDDEYVGGVAVSGTSVYVAGTIYTNSANAKAVAFGTIAVKGASAALSQDAVLAKYTDQGTSATVRWVQVGGGAGNDQATAVAVSNTSVYLTGTVYNTTTNGQAVVLGGNGTTAGTTQVNGASSTPSSDLLLAKYQDNGATATLGWTQVGGGTGGDSGNAVAVSGSSVYVSGYLTNTTSNSQAVVFGGNGTTPGTIQVNGASPTFSQDLLLVKYTDNGTTASYNWAQVGGGTGTDGGNALAVSGTSIYVAGFLTNTTTNANGVLFGGSGTTAGTTQVNGASSMPSGDMLLAKYQDNGATATLGWTQVGGGQDSDAGYAVAVSGTSVYVSGYLTNTSSNADAVLFGGGGTTAGTTVVNGVSAVLGPDVLLAKYTDSGASAALRWTQVGGGASTDQGNAVAVSGTSVYVAGNVSGAPTFAFGSAGNVPLQGTTDVRALLAVATDAGATGTWSSVAAAYNGGLSTTRGVATDASGNVFVTGYFIGQVDVGSTRLSSAGGYDLFVAKYVPGTGTWAWAQAGGGQGADLGYGIAVRGPSVYVTGTIANSTGNANTVRFGGTGPATSPSQVNGATSTTSQDVLLAKYTDQGATATLSWTQVAGGTSADQGQGVAVSGTSVYVTGFLTSSTANSNAVVFGGGGTTAGTAPVNGASGTSSSDVLLAKYQDNGSSATYGWAQVAGGISNDIGNGVAVSGTSVYVSGYFTNNAANTSAVVVGGSGTTPGTTSLNGTSSSTSADLLLAKYQDNGPSATLGWTQVGGGVGSDSGQAVAVSGTSVYVAGTLYNNVANTSAVVFGGNGTTAGTAQVNGTSTSNSPDVLLAKYTDSGPSATLRWTQVGGGTSADYGYGLAVSGTSIYVAGTSANSQSNANGVVFGGGGTTPGTTTVAGASPNSGPDVLLTKYTDNGATGTYNWAQVGGGPGVDFGYGVAVSGQQVYAAGYATPVATFGPTTLTTPAGTPLAVLARLTDPTLLPTRPATSTTALTLYPNPTRSAATLTGATPGAAVQVLDVLGRVVATTTADSTGTAALGGLPAGLYVVRAGAGAVRLSVE